MRKFISCVAALLLIFNVACSSAEPKEFTAEDLGIVRVSDNFEITLDTPIATVIKALGEPADRYVKYHLEDGKENMYDQIRLSYDGISLWYFRGFETLNSIIITDAIYRTFGGFSVGDDIKDIKRIYLGVEEYEDIAVISVFDGELLRGFMFEYDSKGIITEIALAISFP